VPLVQYTPKKFNDHAMAMLVHANRFLRSYQQQGLDCTLRQLYYQFVQANLLPNKVKSYDWLGNLINDGRMAGLVDWDHIVDRTRNVQALAHWDRPSAIIASAERSFAMDRWANQRHYLEVWVEKDALRGVIAKACNALDVAHFSCRGYTSQSEAWAAGQRLLVQQDKGKEVHILHLGDHDPSGIDMTRDIADRLALFTHGPVHVERLALNMAQVEQYDLVPNPAKVTDSRFEGYREKYGDESWELDALNPGLLVELITKGINQYRDTKLWEQAVALEERGRATINYAARYWPDVVKFLRERRTRDNSPIVCTTCFATQANPHCLCKDSTGPAIQLGAGEEY
jgi:hypothetical protein